MKYFIFLFLTVFLSLNHCKTNSSAQSQPITNSDVQNYYYTVTFEFTKHTYRFISKNINDGNLSFDIQTPTDMFLVAYKDNKLLFLSELDDPLVMRSIGENELEQTIDKAQLNINLPKEFSKINDATIFIYKVNEYVENFDTEIKSIKSLATLEQKQLITKRYTINSKELASFLNKK
ncbi:hypothetical protein [uncultured Tenacibaculum sp.]|uniref:hypothetical protein n=1 Tax=uncultured Tenacibaculum sp. TaxID=174713 RepID=UPI002610658E|nr:hypothetical protein [uncultured Tenacibaculum sp.]